MTAMKKWLETTTKQLVWWLIIHSTIWIDATYMLAFLGREDIAESLSKVIVTEIIGTLFLYIVSKTVENVFKNNEFVGVKKKDGSKRDI